MKKHLFWLFLFACLLLSSCGSNSSPVGSAVVSGVGSKVPVTRRTPDTAEVAAAAEDAAAYAAANGCTAFFPDCLNPLRWIYIGADTVTERMTAGGVEVTHSMTRSAIAHVDTASVGSFVTLTLTDNAGGTMTFQLSPADAQSVKAALGKG